MTHLEKLKQELAELELRIHSATASESDSITLTRDQLKEFAKAVQTQTFEKVKNQIEDSIYLLCLLIYLNTFGSSGGMCCRIINIRK